MTFFRFHRNKNKDETRWLLKKKMLKSLTSLIVTLLHDLRTITSNITSYVFNALCYCCGCFLRLKGGGAVCWKGFIIYLCLYRFTKGWTEGPCPMVVHFWPFCFFLCFDSSVIQKNQQPPPLARPFVQASLKPKTILKLSFMNDFFGSATTILCLFIGFLSYMSLFITPFWFHVSS